jgi:archaemetzincin
MATIHLQTAGTVDNDVMRFLERRLSALWPVETMHAAGVPDGAYNDLRRQYVGSLILKSLPDAPGRILGVTEVDLYEDDLNFIFGLAYGNKAVISLKRLHQEFYCLPPDPDILNLRALKEAMHELGHVFGLRHCSDPRCVMYFSNSIADTDRKDWRYCGWCDRQLVDTWRS